MTSCSEEQPAAVNGVSFEIQSYEDFLWKKDPVDTIHLANGCSGNRILAELEGSYRVQILDCRGREISCTQQVFEGITPIAVPSGGLAVLTK